MNLHRRRRIRRVDNAFFTVITVDDIFVLPWQSGLLGNDNCAILFNQRLIKSLREHYIAIRYGGRVLMNLNFTHDPFTTSHSLRY